MKTSNYKLIIFDLDGTAIPNREDGMPSLRLIQAVSEAKKKVKVAAATGRPLSSAKPIIDTLGISDLCVISGGTQVYDSKQNKITWEKKLTINQVKEILKISEPYNFEVLFNEEEWGSKATQRTPSGNEYIVYLMVLTEEVVAEVMSELSSIPQIAAHQVMSWTPGHFDIHITHSEATKKHAIEIILEKMEVTKEQTIGVGDSNNDLPLFESVNLKIAMGNASEALKDAADYVTDTVENDGLAKAIEKFILHT